MPVLVIALLGSELCGVPGVVATAAAADGGGGPKVAIVVGPAGANTAGYRADADSIAASALRYTSNVVTVYSPYATWPAVKAAIQDASVLVYMGHGNGFPSPYGTTLRPATQDGIGVNPVAGGDDSTTQYYGESYLAGEVRLAPNALVMLIHLCYASGNSEPGRPEPSLAVAEQRADNFAAGFLAAGAGSVIASAYYGGAQYIDSLFSADVTVDQLWQAGPGANPNVIAFPSARTPGATGKLNPDASTGKYWRSLVGRLDLRTVQVTGGAGATAVTTGPGAPAPTAGSVPAFPVPGVASIGPAGGQLFGSPSLVPDPATGEPLAYVPAGTPVRLDAVVGVAQDGSSVYAVSMLDGSGAGYLAGSAFAPPAAPLRPVDSVPPKLAPASASAIAASTFAPNGDGVADSVRVPYLLDEASSIDVRVGSPDGGPVRAMTIAAAAGSGTIAWDGRSDAGSVVPDGPYTLLATPRDAAGNVGAPLSKALIVYGALSSVRTSVPVFFPQATDGVPASTTLSFALATPAAVMWTVTDSSGRRLLTHLAAQPLSAGTYEFAWDGRDEAGAVVVPGTYYSLVRASTGRLTFAIRTAVVAAAFSVRAGDATPARGETITVTASPARMLVGPPTLTFVQPGVPARTVTMAAMSRSGWPSYRVRIRLVSGKASGTLRLVVTGRDAAGLTISSSLALPLG